MSHAITPLEVSMMWEVTKQAEWETVSLWAPSAGTTKLRLFTEQLPIGVNCKLAGKVFYS